jgi:ribosome-associated protein
VEGDQGAEGVLAVGPHLRIPHAELVWRFSPSGGPGGQHANTSHTRAEVRFDIEHSPSLDATQRSRLMRRFGPELRVTSQRERSQARNRADAMARLVTLLTDGLRVDRVRRPTRATAGSVERRLDAKRRRSTTKAARRRPADEG